VCYRQVGLVVRVTNRTIQRRARVRVWIHAYTRVCMCVCLCYRQVTEIVPVTNCTVCVPVTNCTVCVPFTNCTVCVLVCACVWVCACVLQASNGDSARHEPHKTRSRKIIAAPRPGEWCGCVQRGVRSLCLLALPCRRYFSSCKRVIAHTGVVCVFVCVSVSVCVCVLWGIRGMYNLALRCCWYFCHVTCTWVMSHVDESCHI